MNQPASLHSKDTIPFGVMAFVSTAFVFLVLGFLMLAARPTFLSQEILGGHAEAWIQLMTYGFGLSAYFGLVYWALPQAFKGRLFSRRAATIHYVLHLAGLILILVAPFLKGISGLGMGTLLIGIGGILFVANAGLSLRRVKRAGVAGAFVGVSLLWVLCILLLGWPFTEKAPLEMLAGKDWSAGWLILAAGVVLNACYGLALQVLSIEGGPTSDRGQFVASLALALVNLGIAWLFTAIISGPEIFAFICAGILLVGSLVYLAHFWGVLQRQTDSPLPWDRKIFLTAVGMLSASVALLMYDVWERLVAAEAVPGEDMGEEVGDLVWTASALDWSVGLMALLMVAIPGLMAVIFQLANLRKKTAFGSQADGFRERLAGQVLLASFFNYAVGACLVVVGAWGSEDQMLSLGALFLVIGSLGFVARFVEGLFRTPEINDSAEQNPMVAAR